MGMDYVPHNDIKSFHLNWTGHGYMAELLDGLGADMDNWAGTKGGDEIPDEMALVWAQLLEDALADDRIKERRYANPSCFDGFATRPEVGVPACTWFRAIYDHLFPMPVNPQGEPEIVEITTATKNWIKDFAAFLRDCGGCDQH